MRALVHGAGGGVGSLPNRAPHRLRWSNATHELLLVRSLPLLHEAAKGLLVQGLGFEHAGRRWKPHRWSQARAQRQSMCRGGDAEDQELRGGPQGVAGAPRPHSRERGDCPTFLRAGGRGVNCKEPSAFSENLRESKRPIYIELFGSSGRRQTTQYILAACSTHGHHGRMDIGHGRHAPHDDPRQAWLHIGQASVLNKILALDAVGKGFCPLGLHAGSW